ncbi:MAG: lamin tail domain-containing protein [Chloroflexi bacterium]|nr:lamin tail domain-containing protein [Chloroflexota bacterium]MCI0580613.1 lamin tail domain-containing protein [Chloroflexota bacterium]MCI0649723.1 lamin tail domain-containing protein [Chloroflexota bacterium]MCI0727771.1 lamin tail domain-containing protein [Chloroflexota bacterium]
MSVRRMLPFIFINIIVSAVVVLAILFWWDSRRPPGTEIVAGSTPLALTTPLAGGTAPVGALSSTEAAAPPAAETRVHIVQAGETLGSISQLYDVPLGDIMQANGLSDPNFIQVNQELVIPIGGLPTPTSIPTLPPTAAVPPTPIPTDLPVEGEVIIEIREVIGVGDLATEAVSIANVGSRPVALLNWQLQDEQGRVYTFGQVTLFGDGAAILVHSGAGRDGLSDVYWGLTEPTWEAGETVTLVDNEGTSRATYMITGG